MIKYAKVSLSAVRKFRLSANNARDYSSKLDKGISCIAEFCNYLKQLDKNLEKGISNTKTSQEKLKGKIKTIEQSLANLTSKLNKLKDQLSSLEHELSITPKTITISDADGNGHEVPNPKLLAIEGQIEATRLEILSVETEIMSLRKRLDRANSVKNQMAAHIDSMNSIVYSLSGKISVCEKLKSELKELKLSNSDKSIHASENLKKIENIISKYLSINLYYTNIVPCNVSTLFKEHNINININTNKPSETQSENTETEQVEIPPKEEIKEHKIKFDENKRICEYEGRKYGGKYNSYETRIDKTLLDNSIYGKYEGQRGESKFIPSNRTAKGITAKEKIAKYGLDGIVYRNAEPDFEVCAEAVVKIQFMTKNREDYQDTNGMQLLGNFSQADIELAKKWCKENKNDKSDWTARDIRIYRKKHKLSWHEKCDTETMVLVPTGIHEYFKHSGGCFECKTRDSNEGGFDK